MDLNLEAVVSVDACSIISMLEPILARVLKTEKLHYHSGFLSKFNLIELNILKVLCLEFSMSV